MTHPFSGGCLCGDVRYECKSAPAFAYYCHCTDCQKASGTAFHTGLLVSRDDFTVTSGEAKTWSRPSDAGNTVTHAFCGNCGAQLYVYSSAGPERLSIKAGSLDDTSWIKPELQIWTQSEVPWSKTDQATEHFSQGRK